ncbi:MAG TPA: pyridoxal-phosphate dependent enzyme [Chloroflexota bacterium]|nr:pyridoxal-phosphate dependent enzyme [Chloroflexota bacterium]
MQTWLHCRCCGAEYELGPYFQGCPACEGALEVAFEYGALRPEVVRDLVQPGGPARSAALLPVEDLADVVTLGEGNTPLIPSTAIGPSLDLEHCFFKNETMNPTWGHKDRAQSLMLTKAREFGYQHVATTSTGNHGASAAAYTTRAGLRACVVLCPPETADLLLHLIDMYNGIPLVADWAVRHEFLHSLVKDEGWYPATGMRAGPASNPYGVDGYKSIAYEIVRDLGRAPDQMFMASAIGDSFYGVYKGFQELLRYGVIDRLPRMNTCQPAGANVLEQSVASGLRECITLPNPQSVAISVREPTSGEHALEAIYQSDGRALSVPDEQILEVMRAIGREGLCVEPASAVAVAGLIHARQAGWVADDEYVVAVPTSSGVKWPHELSLVTSSGERVQPTIADLQRVLRDRGLDVTFQPVG